jgi:hypothetical protein
VLPLPRRPTTKPRSRCSPEVMSGETSDAWSLSELTLAFFNDSGW